jgi:5-histidylcysteine sulfoxide synthase/putative 4-mercaptohistidine N1-methyltranferase
MIIRQYHHYDFLKLCSMNLKELITKTIDLTAGDPVVKRKAIREYFLKTWEIDELLYAQLKSDDIFYHRGDPLRHILLFYLGHTAVFYINKLLLAGIIRERINPAFESIFAIGVDEMSWDDLNNNHYNWPAVADVRAYRNQVKQVVLRVIDEKPLSLPIDWESPFWIVMMGIEHERIHLETSSVLIRQLPLDEVVAGRFGALCSDRGEAPVDNPMLPVSGADLVLGKPNRHPYYGWDNEYGSLKVKVKDFEASQMLVSNRDFLSFVEDGGYDKQELWTEEGWKWNSFRKMGMPLFWRKDDKGYRLRLVAEEIDMPWSWPVEVNYLEAKAYCNWMTARTGKQYRLPTEAEWYRLADLSLSDDQPLWKVAPGNINLEHFASPCPVDTFKQGDFYDVLGNVWQWTETPITGYPGFKVHPMYDDFSTPTFDGKHNLIKGGSWISTGNEATYHSRYAFRRHFYQHAGFRLVQSDAPLEIHADSYENDAEVAMSCENQWGVEMLTSLSQPPSSGLSPVNYHVALARLVIDKFGQDLHLMNVLDLNADTGRLAFELAPYVKELMAIDFSARFIRMPIHLQERGFMRYIVTDENDLVLYRDLVLADTGLGEGVDRIKFMQDNANNLKPVYRGYDLILLPNVLEELTCPVKFLKDIHGRLNPGGRLLIASDYDWSMVLATEKDELGDDCGGLPGGFKQDGEPVSSLEGITTILTPHFSLDGSPVELVRQERYTTRKWIHRVCEVTFWKLKE